MWKNSPKRYPMYFGIILLDSTYMPPFNNIDCWGVAGVTRKYDSIARDACMTLDLPS